MNKKGLTLIELLGVIVLIGIISLIIVPSVLGVIEKSRRAVYKDSAYGYIAAAKLFLANHIDEIEEDDEIYFICDGTSCKYKNEELSFKGEVPKKGLISITGKGEATIENLYNGRYYANKEVGKDVIISDEESEVLSRDELTKLVYELKEEVNTLKKNSATKNELDAVATVAKSSQEDGKNHATKDELQVVSSVANANTEKLKTVASQEIIETVNSAVKANQTNINTNKKNISTNTSSISTINNTIKTLATKTDLEAVSSIASNAQALAKSAATQSNLESITAVANNAQELAKKAATQSSLDVVTTIATNAQELAKKAATQSDLETISTIAKNAQSAVTSKATKAEALDAAYPVGSIYVSTSLKKASEVNAKLGGTWEAYGVGRTLRGTDATSGETGGSDSVKLTASQIPTITSTGSTGATTVKSGIQSANHAHSIPALSGTATGGNHRHSLSNDVFNGGGTGYTEINVGSGSAKFYYNGTYYSNYSGNLSLSVVTSASTTGNNNANHTHQVGIPTLTATTTYTNNSQSNINVQNPYITVYMWKRVK